MYRAHKEETGMGEGPRKRNQEVLGGITTDSLLERERRESLICRTGRRKKEGEKGRGKTQTYK